MASARTLDITPSWTQGLQTPGRATSNVTHHYAAYLNMSDRITTRRISMRSAESWSATAAQLTQTFEGRFVLEDWHSFGADYDRTLMAWYDNIEAAWPRLPGRYSARFRRMWRYYLLTCAGTFRARRDHLWELVRSPRGVRGGYHRVSE